MNTIGKKKKKPIKHRYPDYFKLVSIIREYSSRKENIKIDINKYSRNRSKMWADLRIYLIDMSCFIVSKERERERSKERSNKKY